MVYPSFPTLLFTILSKQSRNDMYILENKKMCKYNAHWEKNKNLMYIFIAELKYSPKESNSSKQKDFK